MPIQVSRNTLILALAVIAIPFAGHAANWPQWRHDANRTAAVAEDGPERGQLLWRLRLGLPDPAYDHQYRMCADVTYAPAAAEGLVFIPSNTADQVVARDLETGAVRWRYFAEGPVRFAPLYRDGKVFFVSDDGYLHCVAAQDGELVWKVRGAPEALPDCRMLVNGRMCSRWPARGGPVEYDGVVYFGAGIWPEEGAFVCAVEADTGQVLWRNDTLSYVQDGMSDHGRPYDLSLPPQGYLAVIDGKLAVPSGRSLAAWFDLTTGEREPYTCFYTKHNPPRGIWYLSGINHLWVQGGNWFGTRPDAAPARPAALAEAKSPVIWSRDATEAEEWFVHNRPFLAADTYRLHDENLYIEPVLTETTLYASEYVDDTKYLVPRGHTHVKFPAYDRIVARDLTKPRWTTLTLRNVAYGPKPVKMPRLEFPLVWELKSPLRVLIKAGDYLYAGGEDTLAAIAIPEAGEAPRVAWEIEVAGTPVNALVADGKLVVVTNTGEVCCFGSVAASAKDVERDGSTEQSTSLADAATRSPQGGYAWVLCWGDGSRAMALAREDYRVVVSEPDPAKAITARDTLADAGLRGRKVQVIQGKPVDMLFTPYWANVVSVESFDGMGPEETVLSAALEALRPYTGKLLLPDGQRHVPVLERLLAKRTGYAMAREGADVTVHRQAPPDGADDWTHEAGGADNAFANSESNVKWPLAALWYSGDIDRYFTPAGHFQHERHPYPLVVGGRMFLVTYQFVHAIDIYTGNYLWKAEMPLTPWVQTRFFDSRLYGRPTDCNCVAAKDWVYAIAGDTIHAFDVVTGEQMKVFEIPSQLRGQAKGARNALQKKRYMGHEATIQGAPLWTEVRLWNDLLIAFVGKTLVALDRHSGEVRWTRETTQQTTTCALSDDALYGLDCDFPKSITANGDEKVSGLLFALNPANGQVVWQRQPEYAATPKQELQHDRLWLRPVTPVLAYNAKHGLLVMTVNRVNLHVFRAADGTPVWSKLNLARGDLQGIYPPAVTDDYLVLSNYKGCYGYLLDVRTGEELGADTGIPRPRTCARIIGNNNLLVYRDSATELYDIEGNRMIGFNSVRSGCTTSFIPAGGIMTAPMLGHGCVCNFPMFASVGLYHWPKIDDFRPEAVTKSWTNQAAALFAELGDVKDPFASAGGEKIDLSKFTLINAKAETVGSALLFATKDEKVGYAVRQAEKPLEKATFTLSLKRAPGTQRHGNAFFVCGTSDKPEDWVECRLYYGGRSSLMLAGGLVELLEQKITLKRRDLFTVEVSVDCKAGTVTFEAAGAQVTAKLNKPVEAITHYGYGGGNSDNYFTGIEVE